MKTKNTNLIKSYKKSGEITVFLSLIFILICLFLGALIKSAKDQFIRNRIETATDMAIKSAFSEYSKQLFEQYNLLYVDTTYKGVTDGGDLSFLNHFNQYFELNLYSENTSDYGLRFISSEVLSSTYASNNDIDEEMYEDIRDKVGLHISYETLLCEATVVVYVESETGKVYECTKSYRLNE